MLTITGNSLHRPTVRARVRSEQDIVFVSLSTRSDPPVYLSHSRAISKAITLGATDYLIKPCKTKDLLDILRRYVR